MSHKFMSRKSWLAVACAGMAVGQPVFAQHAQTAALEAEPALAYSADDPRLAWGGCPEFLPSGCAIAVLHGDPSKPNVDILFKVPGKSEIEPHTHTSAERMVLVAGEMRVTYEGQPAVVLTPGTYAYGPAGRAHRASCLSDGPCILFIAFESPLDATPVDAAGH